MSEQNMRKKVVLILKEAGLDPVSVENPCHPGTPDINHTRGWLELKWDRRWPKCEDTPLDVPHFTQQQKIWLTRRWAASSEAYLLLQVKHDWLLFNGAQAARLLGKATRQQLIDGADAHWHGLSQVRDGLPHRV